MKSASPLLRYMLGLSLWMGIYMALILFNGFYFRHKLPFDIPAEPWRYVFALLPSVPVAGIIWVILRFIEDSDEYVRALLIRRFVIATGMTMVLSSAYTFAENYLEIRIFDHLYVFALFMACLFIVTPFTLGARCDKT